MNWLDLLLLGLFLFACSLGYQKGLLKQAITIGGLLLGIVLSAKHHVRLTQSTFAISLEQELGRETVHIGAYIAIFLLTVLALQLCGIAIRKALDGNLFGQLDSFFGGAFAVLKVYFLCGALALGIFRFLPPQSNLHRFLSQSYMGPRIASGVNRVFRGLPEDIRLEAGALVGNMQNGGKTPASSRRTPALTRSRRADRQPKGNIGYYRPTGRRPPERVRT